MRSVFPSRIESVFVLAISIGSQIAGAQSATPAFELASVRRIGPDANGRQVCDLQSNPLKLASRISGNTLTLRITTLGGLIMDAYNVRDDQFAGLPDWADCHETYEISARAATANVTEDQVRLMLQTLLAERFQLRVRHETRRLTLYEMSIAKGGLKVQVFPERTEGNTTPWGRLSTLIQLFLDYPLVDKTGISGFFSGDAPPWDNAKLQEEEKEARPAGLAPGTFFRGLAPSIFHEVESAYGLTLNKATAPSDFLVIEHLGRPSAN